MLLQEPVNAIDMQIKRKRSASSELRYSKATRHSYCPAGQDADAMHALMALASVASEAEDHEEEVDNENDEQPKQEMDLICKEEEEEEEEDAEEPMAGASVVAAVRALDGRQASEASEEPASTAEGVGHHTGGVESQLSVASTASPSSMKVSSKLDDFQQKFVLTLRRALANKKAERAHVVARLADIRRVHSAAVKLADSLNFPEDGELESQLRLVAQRKVDEYAKAEKECQAALHEIEMWADTWLRSAEGPNPAASMARLYES